MLPAFKGRINRKTFLIGNIVGLSVLGFVGLIYIVPLAIIDIVVNGSHASSIFKYLYALFIIPAIFYFFYFSVLFVKRMHDIGYPGILILWLFIIAEGVSRVLNIWEFNILGLLLILALCALPGRKARNNFGPSPGKKFKLHDLVVKF
jgi:uncharacterized membrane protein YhaH (DUF805 family)